MSSSPLDTETTTATSSATPKITIMDVEREDTRDINSIKFRKHRSLFLSNVIGLTTKEMQLLAKKSKSTIAKIRPRSVQTSMIIDFESHADAVKFWNYVHGKTAAEIFREDESATGFDKNRTKRILISWVINRATKEAMRAREAARNQDEDGDEEEDEDEDEKDDGEEVTPAPVRKVPPPTTDDVIIGGQKPLQPKETPPPKEAPVPPKETPKEQSPKETTTPPPVRFVDTQKAQVETSSTTASTAPAQKQLPPHAGGTTNGSGPKASPHPVGFMPGPPLMYPMYTPHQPRPFVLQVGTASETLVNASISNDQYLRIMSIVAENNYLH